MQQLTDFGWNDDFAEKWRQLQSAGGADGLQPGRVVADFGTSLKLAMPESHSAELTGNLAHGDRQAVPKVGDWVAARLSDDGHAVVELVIPRHSEIARKVAGNRTVKQVIAANVDIAFVLLALDDDFSIERLKRYLYQLSVGNIQPVIVLNKADKAEDVQAYLDQLEDIGQQVIISQAVNGLGVDDILQAIKPGRTAILLGSSGVGKSTLTNHLLGRDEQQTQSVRQSDSTGKHTTVHRELFMLPNGGLLIDTPGMRELQLWGTEADLDENFDDITELARHCKFSNCQHQAEAGCAVRPALQSGKIPAAHYANYQKMKHELVGLKAKNWVKKNEDNRKSYRHIKRQAKQGQREMRDEQ
jgi:ribosome biogenesis GTPase